MGIRTPSVHFNLFLHYLLIVCRFILFCLVTMWLIPTIIRITRDTILFPGIQVLDEIENSDCDDAKEYLNYSVTQILRLTVFCLWFLLISVIVFFFCCLKKMRLRCEPEWFLKYFKDYLFGYVRKMIV